MQQQIYQDLELPKGSQVHVFRFRGKQWPHHLEQWTKITLPDGSYYEVRDSAESQLWSHCDGNLRDLRKVRDWRIRNLRAQELLNQRLSDQSRNPLILRLPEGSRQVAGVVTSLYTEVTHTEVFETVEMLLKANGLEYKVIHEIETSRKTMRTLMLDQQIGEGIDTHTVGLTLTNSETGMASVGVYLYVRRQICSNGMMANTGIHSQKLRHIGDKTELQTELWRMIEQTIQSASFLIPAINASKNTCVIQMDVERFLTKDLHYPDHLSRTISQRQGQHEGWTVYGLVNAMTWVASHHDQCAKSYQLKLQQDAHRLLMEHNDDPFTFLKKLRHEHEKEEAAKV